MKEQSKTSVKELSDEDIANLSDGEFKALLIKMLTELFELGWKMKEQNERHPKWNKAKYSGNQQWQEGNQIFFLISFANHLLKSLHVAVIWLSPWTSLFLFLDSHGVVSPMALNSIYTLMTSNF